MAQNPKSPFQSQIDVRSPSQDHGKQNPFSGMWQSTIDTFKNGIHRVFPGGPEVGEYGIGPASVLQTPYAADAVPEPNPQGMPASTTAAIGAAGTAIYSGFVTDLGEYKGNLMGNNAFPTWERMRRSDPDVYAGLLACKLPVRAATFQVVPGSAENDTDRKFAIEIAKFVEDNLFGGLETITSTGFYQTQDFGKVIENTQLMLDFGCACDEILWHVDGSKVTVRRLAPRLPITYFRYWPDSDGETLLALEQYGYRGDCLPVETPIPGPDGWKTMIELQVGDTVFDESGNPAKVTAKSPVYTDKPCYRVTFSDGSSIVATDNHKWTVWDETTRMCYSHRTGEKNYPADWWNWSGKNVSGRLYTPADDALIQKRLKEGLTTKEIAAELGRTESVIRQYLSTSKAGTKRRSGAQTLSTVELIQGLRRGRSYNYAIPFTGPLAYKEQQLPIHPYVLGYLLGDGNSSGSGDVACTPEDKHLLIAEFGQCGHSCNDREAADRFYVTHLVSKWKKLNLYNNKHIPEVYLSSSIDQRIALLQGLIDSDGHVESTGEYLFTNTNRNLAQQMAEVARSLGFKAVVRERKARFDKRTGNWNLPNFVVAINSTVPLSRLPRKLVKARHDWKMEQHGRSIVSIEPVEMVATQCITVDSPSSLYLAGREYIPTHNSYVNVVLPAQKIDYYVREQEGADYFGFSILRRAYQAWYFKTRLYAIDGIALERNAMGVPVITLGQGASKENREYASKFVQAYSAHENTGLVIPETWKFGIEGTKGRLRDPKTSIQHYSNQILKSMMAGFLDLGNTQTGSRSLAGDLIGLFKVGLNEQARNIANTMNNSVIRRLVDYNYGDSRRRVPYPKLVVSNIVAVDFLDVADKIKNLAQWQSDIIQPDDELENLVRKELGLSLKAQTRPRTMPVQMRLEPKETLTPEQAEEEALEISEGKVDTRNNPEVNPDIKTPVPAPAKSDVPSLSKGATIVPLENSPVDKGNPEQPKAPAKKPAPTVGGSPNSIKNSEHFFGTEQLDSIIEVLELLSDDKADRSAKWVAVDFDGVINIVAPDESHTYKSGKFGQVSQNAVALLRHLKQKNFKITIFTARKDLMDVHDFLHQHDLPFDDITNGPKPRVCAYIDDRGVHVDWGEDFDPVKFNSVLAQLELVRIQHDE